MEKFKRGRGRPKGSKNIPKHILNERKVWVETPLSLDPVVVGAVAMAKSLAPNPYTMPNFKISIAPNVPDVVPVVVADGVKTCIDCTEYLLCKKVKAGDEVTPMCEEFVDNFPEDKDDWEKVQEGEEATEDLDADDPDIFEDDENLFEDDDDLDEEEDTEETE